MFTITENIMASIFVRLSLHTCHFFKVLKNKNSYPLVRLQLVQLVH